MKLSRSLKKHKNPNYCLLYLKIYSCVSVVRKEHRLLTEGMDFG